MSQTLINRYQPGGDIYARLLSDYGKNAADLIAEAARTGDRTEVTDALTFVKHGQPLNDSTGSILLDQLITNPLGAPLDALDKGFDQLLSSKAIKAGVAAAVIIAGIYVITRFR